MTENSLDFGNQEMDRMIRGGTETAFNSRRQVSTEAAYGFAMRNKMFYMEVSSKTGHNVDETFYKMATEVNELHKRL